MKYTGVNRSFNSYITIILCLSLSPFMLFDVLNVSNKFVVILIFLYFSALLFKLKKININNFIYILLIIQAFFIIFLGLHHGLDHLSILYDSITFLLIIITIFLFNNNYIDTFKFLNIYLKLLVVLSVLAIISTILLYFGYFEPIAVYDRGLLDDDGGNIIYIAGLTLSNTVVPQVNGFLIRPSGLFDEPGQFGIYLLFALFINKVTIQDKLYEVILILAGLITTSLGFFISILLYLFFWRIRYLFFIIIIALLIFLFTDLDSSNQIYQMTLQRIFDLITGASGNRNLPNELRFTLLEKSGFFGIDKFEISSYEIQLVSSTYLQIFIFSGILGGLVYYSNFIYIFIKLININFKFDYFIIFTILIISLYHRPVILYYAYFILFYLIFTEKNSEKSIKFDKYLHEKGIK